MALPGGYSGGGLPATTPADFADYLNAHFKGDGGKLGGPVAALDSQGATGSSLGAQWLSWYAQEQQLHPGLPLLDYETAFVLLWEDATLGIDLASGLAGGVSAVGTEATNSVPQLPGLAAIGDFFSRLTQGATWIRVAEVLIGGILLLAALNKALGNPAGRASRALA